MWPLSFFLFFGMVAQQEPATDGALIFQQKLHTLNALHTMQVDRSVHRLSGADQSNICFTMRSYYFRRQDGQAPVPAGMTTCTPASVLRQRQVSPQPGVQFVPLAITSEPR